MTILLVQKKFPYFIIELIRSLFSYLCGYFLVVVEVDSAQHNRKESSQSYVLRWLF
jgi:hypothetical protein